jgi:hypothetical protein
VQHTISELDGLSFAGEYKEFCGFRCSARTCQASLLKTSLTNGNAERVYFAVSTVLVQTSLSYLCPAVPTSALITLLASTEFDIPHNDRSGNFQ